MKKHIFTILLVILFSVSVYSQTDCPKIKIIGPQQAIKSGETMRFSVNVAESVLQDYKIIWSVDKGAIIKWQGTTTILVSTDGLSETVVTAKVKLEGIPDGCKNSAEDRGIVEHNIPICCPHHTWGELSENDLRKELDLFFVDLANRELSTGYLVNYGSIEDINSRKKIILEHAKLRKFDISRIEIVDGGREEKIRTRPWMLPCPKNIIAPNRTIISGERIAFSLDVNSCGLYQGKLKWTIDKGLKLR